jgi:hypothetical protein
LETLLGLVTIETNTFAHVLVTMVVGIAFAFASGGEAACNLIATHWTNVTGESWHISREAVVIPFIGTYIQSDKCGGSLPDDKKMITS